MGFTSLTVLHAAATSYVVNRLLPYTKYEFIVIPFQRGSPGAASALVEAYTMAVSRIFCYFVVVTGRGSVCPGNDLVTHNSSAL